jgi:hypothetical protein
MARRSSTKPSIQLQRINKVDLDKISATSSTEETIGQNGKDDRGLKSKENVPPPFKGDGEQKYISWPEFNLAAKVGGALVVFGVPLIWFFSNMNHELKTLVVEVSQIKVKMENIFDMSIRSQERLSNTDKSIENIKQQQSVTDKTIENLKESIRISPVAKPIHKSDSGSSE